MNLSIDFDDTYTRDPDTWDKVIEIFRSAGHKVYCVTWRSDTFENKAEVGSMLNHKVDAIFFTGQQAKKEYMYAQGIVINVWIDDMPFAVEEHGAMFREQMKTRQTAP